MKVSQERIMKMIEKIRTYGGTPDKGVTRLAYSPEDLAAHVYVIEELEKIGCLVRRDAVGNIFARLLGQENNLPIIATGSHVDSVRQGGHLDGVLGVVAGVEVARLAKEQPLRHHLEVIVFMAEESRFGHATMGSKIAVGMAAPDDFNKGTKAGEQDYVTVVTNSGFKPAEYKEFLLSGKDYKAFFELHIEQGRVLADSKESVGVVENIAAPTRMKVTVEGMADHSGATPMNMRKDALVSAARLIVKVEEIARQYSYESVVGTVGVVEVEPGAINVIPGKVSFWVDLRGVKQESIHAALSDFREAVAEVGEQDEIKIVMDMLSSDNPVPLDLSLADLSESVCQELGITYRRMNSGAGHDAMNMAKIMPTTMLFVPSWEGISHSPAEYTSPEDITLGIQVLWETIRKLDM